MVSEALSLARLVSKAETETCPWAKASASSCRHAGAVFPIAGALLLPRQCLPRWERDRPSLEAAVSLVGALQVTG